eukprot:CAMPEP_0194212106 /NCGR_PEP_ID=MMETSP0156-20130528/11758_1 /TAXON_ID=33649 /ORGANISM="Thalassionema nitzschioides, Strain L26-B" /LENGTH=563 /DNA_ID=CAMNT_0038939845 /DNA_START=60 /DNA_END=1751 /DNA_ORIENTATION=+
MSSHRLGGHFARKLKHGLCFYRARRLKSSTTFAHSQIINYSRSNNSDEFDSSIPDFNDTRAAYAPKTNMQLLRAALVFKLCNISFLVEHADRLQNLSRRILGGIITDKLLKATVFGHFCAGEDEQSIRPTLSTLQNYGVGGILDYAAESDSETRKPYKSSHTTSLSYNTAGKVYDYESEATCDQHVEVFQSCIRSVQEVSPGGFAAIKVTALGNPKLLERISIIITEAKNLFAKLDKKRTGRITREEFEQGYRSFFSDDDERVKDLIDYLDYKNSGHVDYVTWSKRITPKEIPRLIATCREVGPLAHSSPTDEELELIDAMSQRAHKIAEEAVRCKTRLLVDAEQARFQPAIDNLVLELQQTYNAMDKTNAPIVFNTYQCYRKGELDCIRADLQRSDRYNYHFGAKLVRGAYMESERARAKEMEYPSPIYDTIDQTHQCYNDAVEFLLKQRKEESYKSLEIVCATHNQESIEKAIKLMSNLGIDKQNGTISFAQLLGMSDNLTFKLGGLGYQAYKYVPYGKVDEVTPYLIRRAQENSAMLGNSKRELEFLKNEIMRRFSAIRL